MSPEQHYNQLAERLNGLIEDLKYSDPEGHEEGEQAKEMLDLLEEAEELGNAIWGNGNHIRIREERKKHGDNWYRYRKYWGDYT